MLSKILRVTGKVLLVLLGLVLGGAGALLLITSVYTLCTSNDGMAAFAAIFAIAIGVKLLQLAVCCLSPAYAEALAAQDYREMMHP